MIYTSSEVALKSEVRAVDGTDDVYITITKYELHFETLKSLVTGLK